MYYLYIQYFCSSMIYNEHELFSFYNLLDYSIYRLFDFISFISQTSSYIYFLKSTFQYLIKCTELRLAKTITWPRPTDVEFKAFHLIDV